MKPKNEFNINNKNPPFDPKIKRQTKIKYQLMKSKATKHI